MYENLTLHAGDSINLSMLYTDDSSSDLFMYDMNEAMITDFEKMENTIKVGALVHMNTMSNFPFVSFRSISIVTNNQGFDNLGYYSPYRSMFSRLNYIPENAEIDYIERNLMEIASLNDNVMFTSFISINESSKRMVSNVIAVGLTLFALFVVLSVCMINNSLSGSIRSSKVMIGTIRAVGANKSVVNNIFANQLIYMIKNGTIIGTLIFIVIFIVAGSINQEFVNIQQFLTSLLLVAAYTVVLYCICYVNIRIKTKKYIKNSIVENIREL